MKKGSKQNGQKTLISWEVFMSFVDENHNATRVLSQECFNTWVATRQTYPKQPEESFRRVLIGHICGIDRRRPFPERVETSLLHMVRRKEVWECFKGTNVCIGIRGFRKQGFHENKRLRGLEVKKQGRRTKQSQCSVLKKKRKISEPKLPCPRDCILDDQLSFFEGFDRVVAKSDLKFDVHDALADIAFDSSNTFDSVQKGGERNAIRDLLVDTLTIV